MNFEKCSNSVDGIFIFYGVNDPRQKIIVATRKQNLSAWLSPLKYSGRPAHVTSIKDWLHNLNS